LGSGVEEVGYANLTVRDIELMKASDNTLRRVLIAGSAISLLVAVASCVGLAASFIQPALETHDLYSAATFTREAGFFLLGGYLVSGFAFLGAAPQRADVSMSGWSWRVLKVICALCFVLILLGPHTYVYPEAGEWITKSKAGTSNISSGMAREYLWRAVRMWSAIPLCGSLYVIVFARQFVRRTLRATALTGSGSAVNCTNE
jgi:hypothetical protein